MIETTRLDNTHVVLNADLIEHLEATPDTVITMLNGKIWIVRESVDEIVDRVIAFRRSVNGRVLGPHTVC